jgi:hypothetical protein
MANISRRIGVGAEAEDSSVSLEPDSIAVLDREERGRSPANAEEFVTTGVVGELGGTYSGVCPLIKGAAVLGLESAGVGPVDCESAEPVGDGTKTVGDESKAESWRVALSAMSWLFCRIKR